jgi:hypothetical protein
MLYQLSFKVRDSLLVYQSFLFHLELSIQPRKVMGHRLGGQTKGIIPIKREIPFHILKFFSNQGLPAPVENPRNLVYPFSHTKKHSLAFAP